MGLVSAIADTLTTDATDPDAVGYRCRDCDTSFERSGNRMIRVRCPDCGSADLGVRDGN